MGLKDPLTQNRPQKRRPHLPRWKLHRLHTKNNFCPHLQSKLIHKNQWALFSHHHPQNLYHHLTCPGNWQKESNSAERIWNIWFCIPGGSNPSPTSLSPTYDHPINLNESFVPEVGKVYSLTPEEQKVTKGFLEENVKSGKIQPSNSPQESSFFFVGKNENGPQPCQDYNMSTNIHKIKDTYPLPLVSNLIDKVKNAKVFTKFDVHWGYNNIQIKDGNQWKATFITHKGLFEPTVMLFGLCNFPATFQQFVNDSFRDMITEGWLIIYINDLFISSPNIDLNTKQTKGVLQRMKEIDLHLEIKKCEFGVSEINYLRMILQPGEIAMGPAKLDGIQKWPIPTKVKNIWFFLGFENFYQKFISNYSNIARTLIDLTKKDKPWHWSQSCHIAFDHLKQCFLSQLVLHLPDMSKPFAIVADVSKHASGGVLLQIDSHGEWHLCSYLSKLFSPAE